MTQAMVKEMLGLLYAAKIAKTAGIAILIALGLILLALGCFFVTKARKSRRAEDLGIVTTIAYTRMVNPTQEG